MRWQPIGSVADGPRVIEVARPGTRAASRPVLDLAVRAVDRQAEAYESWWKRGMPENDSGQPASGGVQAPPADDE